MAPVQLSDMRSTTARGGCSKTRRWTYVLPSFSHYVTNGSTAQRSVRPPCTNRRSASEVSSRIESTRCFAKNTSLVFETPHPVVPCEHSRRVAWPQDSLPYVEKPHNVSRGRGTRCCFQGRGLSIYAYIRFFFWGRVGMRHSMNPLCNTGSTFRQELAILVLSFPALFFCHYADQ